MLGLFGQGCRTPSEVLTAEYGAMMKWWLARETEDLWGRPAPSVILSTQISLGTWKSPDIERETPGKKPACKCFVILKLCSQNNMSTVSFRVEKEES